MEDQTERKKRISVLIPTYNEEENVIPLSAAIIGQFETALPQYDYEIVFIDNRSTDRTRPRLEALCAENPRIKAIFNVRNFGQFNSPFYGICQTTGDCTVAMCADFQDPVEMIPTLVAEWEAGYRVVCGVKKTSRENKVMRFLRTCYYKAIRRMSSVEQIEHFTGFGLYDKTFVDVLRGLDDPAPFLRGVIAELGFAMTEVPYEQAQRRAGKTHNNFGTLYDAALLSFTTYTKTPVRLMTLFGVLALALSLAGGIACLVLGLLDFPLHLLWIIPVVGFFAGVQSIFLGILGEYILTLRAKLMRRPLVVEEKRINFDSADR